MERQVQKYFILSILFIHVDKYLNMDRSGLMPKTKSRKRKLPVDIAETETAIFIHFDKKLLKDQWVCHALAIFRQLNEDNGKPPVAPYGVDENGIPCASPEEQAELEAILDGLTDEDKEVAFVRRIEL